jgi:hypothetical protein
MYNILSDCYNWLGCWWKSFWCCHRGSHVGPLLSCPLCGLSKWFTVCSWQNLIVCRAQALCTTAAVMGGKSLASQISEKMVGIAVWSLFLELYSNKWNALHLMRHLSLVGWIVKWSAIPVVWHNVFVVRTRRATVMSPGNSAEAAWPRV